MSLSAPRPSRTTRLWACICLLSALYCSSEEAGDEKGLTEQVFFDDPQPFRFGSTHPKDGGQSPVRVTVKPFAIDKTAVTVGQFSRFLKATGHVTDAEKYKWSFVLEPMASAEVIKATDEGLGRVRGSEHWLAVEGATWTAPEGPGSSVKDRQKHPVVHVSWNDAVAYCQWAGRRLPKETEWEYAAKGGLEGPFPWGRDPTKGKLNVWQGKFPKENRVDDGWFGTSPVDAFPSNPFGLHIVGNVWEWVGGGTNEARVLRGGSFIDSLDGSFNHAATVSSRYHNSGDSSSATVGFRCASSSGGKKRRRARPDDGLL